MWHSTWRKSVVEKSKRVVPWRIPGMSHSKKNLSAKGFSSSLFCWPTSHVWTIMLSNEFTHNVMTAAPFFGCQTLNERKLGCLEGGHLILCQRPREFSSLFLFRCGQTTFESHHQHGEHSWLAFFSPESIYSVQWKQLVQIQAASQQRYDRRKTEFLAQIRKLVLVTLISQDRLHQ